MSAANNDDPCTMNIEKLSIRAARKSDAGSLFPIVVEFATSFLPQRDAFEPAFHRRLADQDACVLVAEVDGRLVGYLLGFEHLTLFANGVVSWVEEISVAASFRRNGVGRALMTKIEAWAASRGSRMVALATRRAAEFYSALGYEESASYFRKVLSAMHCPSCNHDNRDAAKFCEECANPLAQPCGACGAPRRPNAKFCDECAAPTASAPQRTPRDYTPKHLADKILQSKSALAGERKQVTVLFADVKGSMELAEQLDPEQWHKILDRFFAILTDGVHRFEGTVNQYTGDGIMALFGAPIAHEDHAQRACYSALHLLDELRSYARELRRAHGLDFAVRIGVNSGDVVVGKIGDDLRMDYTAQGHTVGLAQRMEALAEANSCFVSENTSALASGFFDLADLGRFTVKGMREPVGVFQLRGVGRVRSRLDVARTRGFSKFVGRSQEIATLEHAFARAMEGQGQVVGVVADAGTGKSRLCYEFVERRRHEGVMVREAHAVSHGKTLPFLPVLEFLRGYFGIAEQDTDDMARDKIAGRMVRLDPTLTDALPLLFEFLGVPDPARPAPALNPEARQRQVFAIIRRLVHARSAHQPAVLLWEDLHWMDAASEAFLENLVESIPGTRTLLLVNFRPEYHARWMQKSYYQQLPLLPLGPEAIDELLDHLLGTDPAVAEVRRRLQTRSAGNPFFVEELVQSLVDAGALQGTRGAYRLARPIEEVAIAPTVQAVLAARIDRLAEYDKRVLQTAAVIGKTFSESVLRRVVAPLSEAQLTEAVRALLAGEFLYEEALYPETEYTFKHPLTQEVAYGSQLADSRRQVHAAVAGAIEALKVDKLDEHAALLAHHWENAGEPLAAARAHRRAARWAAGRDAVEAPRHWRRIRELLGSVADSKESLDLRVEAYSQIMLLSARMGGADEEISELFAEATDLAARSHAPASTALVFMLYGFARGIAGRIAEAEAAFEQARGPLAEARDANLEAAWRYSVATTCGLAAGECTRALPLIDEALAFTEHDPRLGTPIIGYSIAGALHAWRGLTLALMGRLDEAARALERATAWGRKGEPAVLMLTHRAFTFVADLLGEPAAAMSRARQSVEITAELGIWEEFGQLNLGMAYLLNEEWNDAARHLEQGLASTRDRRSQLFSEPLFLTALARVHLGRGDAAAARALAEEAIAVAPDRGVYTADAHLVRARALLHCAGTARGEIESAIADAERFVHSSGALSRQPAVHELRAELARLAGDDTARQRELRGAERLFTAMGAAQQAQRVRDQL